MSKVLLINGSPHAHGCTFTALSVVADELQRNGVETEIIHVGHKDIRGCIGCYKCRELGRCVFDKDIVNEVAKKFEQADGLIIGSPVYYSGPNGTLVSFLNRLFFQPLSRSVSRLAQLSFLPVEWVQRQLLTH